MHKLIEKLKCKKGEGYIDTIVLVLVFILLIVFILKVVPVFIKKQQLDNFATEIVRIAEVTGKIGNETAKKEEEMSRNLGISPTVTWSKTGKIQLNEEVEVTTTLEMDIGLFGGFGSFPITLRSVATGKGEVYWKP